MTTPASSPASPGAAPTAAAPDRGSSPPVPAGWIVLTVLGVLLSLLALVPLVVGAGLLWADATQTDDDGFFTTPSERFESAAYAITSEEVDLGSGPDAGGVDLGDLATVRLDVEGAGESDVFVGIGPEEDVARYLDGVARAEVDDIRTDPVVVEYRYVDGGEPPGPPADEAFWVATAEGAGQERLEWDLESGSWTVVVMNADASRGVSADVALGAKADWVAPLGVAFVVVGVTAALVGVALLVIGVVGLARGSHLDLRGPPVDDAHPVQLAGRLDAPLSRWLWLVKWFLLIPHLLVLLALWLAFSVVTVVAFFAILFTGRYPQSLFEFEVGVIRWSWRVMYYGYGALGTDRYPPFSLAHDPDYPATFEVAFPERLSRGLVLVKWWLLAIPQYLVVGIIGFGVAAGGGDRVPFGGLVGLLVIFAGVALLFTGAYPKGLHAFVVGLNRWAYRVLVYAALLRDEYPPFRLDQGAEEPGTTEGEGSGPPRAPTGDEVG